MNLFFVIFVTLFSLTLSLPVQDDKDSKILEKKEADLNKEAPKSIPIGELPGKIPPGKPSDVNANIDDRGTLNKNKIKPLNGKPKVLKKSIRLPRPNGQGGRKILRPFNPHKNLQLDDGAKMITNYFLCETDNFQVGRNIKTSIDGRPFRVNAIDGRAKMITNYFICGTKNVKGGRNFDASRSHVFYVVNKKSKQTGSDTHDTNFGGPSDD